MHSLTDALRKMQNSPALAYIQHKLKAHRLAHKEYFYACESSPCSQIAMHLRCYVEAAEEELDKARNLARARQRAKNAYPTASHQVIEFLTESAAKASSPQDNSSHPLNMLESPYDPARAYNRKYPGLEFHRGGHKNANPAISSAYYLQFRQTDSEDVLFEFMDAHPVEFQCSGWVFSVLAGKLLGPPGPSLSEKEAQDLFRKYWRRTKHPKADAPTLPQLLVLAIDAEERGRFAAKEHRQHFERAVRWLAKQSNSRATSEAFKAGIGSICCCLSQINLTEINKAIEHIQRLEDAEIPPTAHVIQDYAGRVCGVPGRTLRSWRKRFNLAGA